MNLTQYDWSQHVSSFPAKPSVPSKPGYLSTIDIPSLGTKVKRISDHTYFDNNVDDFFTGDNTQLGHAYSRKQVLNSDQTKILLHGGWRWCPLLNADGTYDRTIQQAGKDRCWANTSPHHIYTVDTSDESKVYRVDVRDDSKVQIVDTPWQLDGIGAGEGNISDNDEYIVCGVNDGGSIRIVVVDLQANSYTSFTTGRSYSDYDWASISSQGNYVIVAYNAGVRNIDLYTRAGSFVRRITNQQHADIATDSNGDECLVVVGHVEESAGTALVKHRLSDDQKTILFGGDNEFPSGGPGPELNGHVCASAAAATGWIHVSSYGSDGPHVVFAVKDDGSRKVAYYAFHNSIVGDYRDQPHFNVSRDGNTGIFKSNWGDSGGYTELYLAWQEPDPGGSNTPPVLQQPGNIVVAAGATKTLQLNASDADDDTLSFNTTGDTPAWVTVDSAGEVTAAPGQSITAGDYSVSFVANDGTDDSNVVTINIAVVSGAFIFPADVRLGTQSFPTGITPTHIGQKTISGGGAFRTDWGGHYWFLTASGNQSQQFSGEQNLRNTLGTAYPYDPVEETGLRGMAPKLRWDWIQTGSGVFNGAGVAQLDNHYDYCDANGLICWPDLTDINFGGNTSWDYTKSFAPTFIENAGGAMVGGNPSNISASAKLHVEWVMDEFISCLLFLHNRYKNRPSYVGFTVPETTRAEHTGGSLSSEGNFQNIDFEMFTQFKRMITVFRAGAPGALLKIQFNYLGEYLANLVEHADAAGGVIIGTPDVLRNKPVAIYPIIRQKEGIMGVHVHWETREIENTPDTAWDFCYNDADKLNPQAITHFSGHPYNNWDNTWQQDTLDKLVAENWYFNPTIPSDLSSGDSTEGTNPTHAQVQIDGDNIDITLQPTAQPGMTDPFTLWEGNTPHDAFIPIYDSQPDGETDGDGTPTPYPISRLNPATLPILGSGDPGWEVSADYYEGGHFKAVGSFNAGNKANYEIGQYWELNLATFLPTDDDYHLYHLVYAYDPSSDSWWIKEPGIDMVNGTDQFIPVKNALSWQPYWDQEQNVGETGKVEKLVNRAMGTFKNYVREPGAGIIAIVAVPAAENQLPTGIAGFVPIAWGGGTTITPPPDTTMQVGEVKEFLFTINETDDTPDYSVFLESSDDDKLKRQSFWQSHIDGSVVYGDFKALEPGTYTIRGGIKENAFSELMVSAETQVTVEAAPTIVWPDGINASLPDSITIEQGKTFEIDANPVNTHGFSLSPDRWEVEGDAVSILEVSGDQATATCHADDIGQSSITFRMVRADNVDDPQVWIVPVTVTEATDTSIDDVFIGGDREILDGTEINIRSTENIKFTSAGEWTADDAEVQFGDTVAKKTTVLAPRAGIYNITRTVSNLSDPQSPPIVESFQLTVREVVKTLNPKSRFCSQPRIVIEFETQGGFVYVRDFPSTPVPSGAVVLDALIDASGISAVSQRINFRKGSSDIGTASLAIVDDNQSFSSWLKDVLDSGDSLKDKRVRIYRLCQGDEWTGEQLWRTYIFNRYSSKENLYTVSTMDVQRFMQKDVFKPITGRLVESLTDQSTAIKVKPDGNNQPFPRFQHSDDYRIHPGRAVAYLLLTKTKEVVAVNSLAHGTSGIHEYQILQRRCFQTVSADIVVEPNTSDDNLPAIEEFIYIAGPAPEVAYQVATGKSRDGSVTLPDHWHAHVPPDLIDLASYTHIGDDIESIYLEFARLKKQVAKTFLEKQCYVPMTCAPVVNAEGAHVLTRAPSIQPDAAFDGILTEDDIVSFGNFISDFGTIKTGILLNWGWNWATEKFLHPTLIIDSDAQNQHGYTEYEKLDLKGLQSSAQTSVSVRRIADVIRGHISHEGLGFPINVMPDRDFYDVGQALRLQLAGKVTDPSGKQLDLNRTFGITRRTENIYSGQIGYELSGIGRGIQSVDETANPFNISADHLRQGAPLLSDHCTIVDGVIQGVNNVPAGMYFHDGDLEHDPSTGQIIVSTPGTLVLLVAGSYNPYHPQSVVTDGMGAAGGAGQTDTTDPQAGQSGYIGSVTSANGVKASVVWRTLGGDSGDTEPTAKRLTQDIPSATTRGAVSAVPVLPLKLVSGVLSGYPTNLDGAGSPGAGAFWLTSLDPDSQGDPINSDFVNGADGVPGGGGLMIVSRGGSTGPAGGFSLDGAPGNPGVASALDEIYAGSSAGGFPGALLWLIDGDHFPPVLEGRVSANTGALNIPTSERLTSGGHYYQSAGFKRPSQDPDPQADYSGACVSIQYVPADSVPQESPLLDDSELSPYLSNRLAEIEAAAEEQLDDKANTHIMDVKPSFGVQGDYWVNTGNRDSLGYPDIYKHDGTDYVYVDPASSVIARMLRLQYGNAYIAQGKGAIYYPESTDPNPPVPKSESDLWIQPDTGLTFAVLSTPGGLIWNPKPVSDVYYAPTSANVMVDSVFAQTVNDGRDNYYLEVIEGEVEVEFGAYGEGTPYINDDANSTGATMRIPDESSFTESMAYLYSRRVYPTSYLDDWRMVVRGALYQAGGLMFVHLDLLDKSKNRIGEIQRSADGVENLDDLGVHPDFFSTGLVMPIISGNPNMSLFGGHQLDEVSFVRPAIGWRGRQQGAVKPKCRISSIRLELLPRSKQKGFQVGTLTLPTSDTDVITLSADFGVSGQESTISWQFAMRQIVSNRTVDIQLLDSNDNPIVPGGEMLADDWAIDYAGWRLWQGSISIDAGDEIGQGEQTIRLVMKASSGSSIEVKSGRLYVK